MGKGNTLPGGNAKRVTVYTDPDLWDRFKDWCEENDTSRSKAIRRFMARKVGDDGRHVGRDKATRGYEKLRNLAAPDGTIPGKTAKNQIAQELGIPKSEVARIVLDPLRKRGAIYVPQPGTIKLTDRD